MKKEFALLKGEEVVEKSFNYRYLATKRDEKNRAAGKRLYNVSIWLGRIQIKKIEDK